MRAFAVVALLVLAAAVVYGASGPSGGSSSSSSGGSTTTVIPNPNINASPQSVQPGSVKSVYKCSEFTSRKERIRCRINLDEENEYNYLPEECRQQSGAARGNCTANYKKAQKCWVFKSDRERFDCAMREFALGNIADERAECEVLGDNKSACVRELRSKADTYVKFKFYNLEEKAQRLKGKGVSEDLVVNLVASIEEKKLAYNSARTKEEKKAVVAEVRSLWKAFVAEAKLQLGEK